MVVSSLVQVLQINLNPLTVLFEENKKNYTIDSPSVTADVRNKKIKTATDGYVTQYMDLCTNE